MSKKKSNNLRLGISIGDINGVGMEVIIKTFKDSRMLDFCTPVIYSSKQLVRDNLKVLHISDFNFNVVRSAEEVVSKKINVMEPWKENPSISFGDSTDDGGSYAYQSLKAAALDLGDGKIDALVTAPINKKNIQSEDFDFPGHTEYLAKKFEGDTLMLMVNDVIKIGVATNHIPINGVAASLTVDAIFSKLKILNKALIQDFGINKPRIAVLGLNPHAGDEGLIGKEEQEIIIPAISNANSIGITTIGPYPADGFFGSGSYQKFDGILAMYHDQGLIPFKSFSFGQGVNYTAGLSVIRTSPDHGVAYDIAGKNEASETSFRSAVYLACDIYKQRILYKEMSQNPIKVARVKG